MCQVRLKGFWILPYSTYTPLTVGILYRRKTSDLLSSLGFFPVWIQKVTQELKITPWSCESTWKNGSHVSVCHLSKWMRALPAVTIVPCNKASSCSSSKWDQGSHRLAAYGTRGTKELYIKTALDNITGLLWLAWAAAFNLLELTVILPTPITFTPQIMPKEHYSKITNPLHHGQHLHNQLDSLPACTACAATLQCCCLDNIMLRG